MRKGLLCCRFGIVMLKQVIRRIFSGGLDGPMHCNPCRLGIDIKIHYIRIIRRSPHFKSITFDRTLYKISRIPIMISRLR